MSYKTLIASDSCLSLLESNLLIAFQSFLEAYLYSKSLSVEHVIHIVPFVEN